MNLFSKHIHTPKKQLIEFDELSHQYNPVSFASNRKSKYIRISIDHDLKIKVTYPEHTNIEKAKKFFKSKIIWTENTLIKLSKRKEIKIQHLEKLQSNISKEQFLIKNQYLVTRCKELALKYGFKIGNISLKRQKTIWGSCSSQNNISLNSNLAFLKDELIDYVILHELVHTKVKNHSKIFWKELERILPNAKILDKEMNNYSPKFFIQQC